MALIIGWNCAFAAHMIGGAEMHSSATVDQRMDRNYSLAVAGLMLDVDKFGVPMPRLFCSAGVSRGHHRENLNNRVCAVMASLVLALL